MTREEAAKWLEETIQDTDRYFSSCSEALQKELDEQKEVFLLALSALRPVSREQVRRGEWEKIGADYRGQGGIWRCTECRKTYPYKCDFCPNCGTPMTDEAVQMVMERLEALKDA